MLYAKFPRLSLAFARGCPCPEDMVVYEVPTPSIDRGTIRGWWSMKHQHPQLIEVTIRGWWSMKHQHPQLIEVTIRGWWSLKHQLPQLIEVPLEDGGL